jgi:hypothetical protein
LNRILLKRHSSILSKQANIFTTNVDMLFEVAFEQMGIDFSDGFSGKIRPRFDLGDFNTLRFRMASTVRDAIGEAITTLPAQLRRSLTWDQGIELAKHLEITMAADLPIYFCDPASPWQRGTNENTNGLLRQYFPKVTDLSRHHRAHLDAVAERLNGRPRKTLAWRTPAEALQALLSEEQDPHGVATTP